MVLQIATWLDAVLYISGYRPVPLKEHIKDGNLILDANLQVTCCMYSAVQYCMYIPLDL